MAAKPKLSPEQWALIRTTWETDPREGYAWVVEEMGLDVSAPGIRKTAMRDSWTKCKPAVAAPAGGQGFATAQGFAEKPWQGFAGTQRNHHRNHARNH